jgi:hypothetical protein
VDTVARIIYCSRILDQKARSPIISLSVKIRLNCQINTPCLTKAMLLIVGGQIDQIHPKLMIKRLTLVFV